MTNSFFIFTKCFQRKIKCIPKTGVERLNDFTQCEYTKYFRRKTKYIEHKKIKYKNIKA